MEAASHIPATILLADDEPALRQPLAEAFCERGYRIREASCGLEALEMGRTEQPGLSVLDINLPDITGVEVYRRWLAEGIGFPVIFVTAEASEELRVEAISLGARAVVQKPFGVRELFRLVREVLQDSQEDKQL